MGDLNLDERRAARAEALDDRHLTFRGERFDLPAELPYGVIEVLVATVGTGALTDAAATVAGIKALPELFGDEYDRFKALRPSAADVNELTMWVLEEYGLLKPVAGGDNGGGDASKLDPKSRPSSPQ